MNTKTLLLLLCTAMLFVACTQQQVTDQEGSPQGQLTQPERPEASEQIENQSATHCVPNDPGCTLAEENNVDLYGTIDESKVSVEEINTAEVKGFLAKPVEPGTYPAVLMIHEWWGLNDNIKDLAKLMAQEGYVVLAIDMYGEVATTQEKARELTGKVRADQPAANAKLQAATKYLRTHPASNGKVASMGWCFGGGQSLQLAISGEPLDATVIYYGSLVNDTEMLANIDWPLLGIFGALDTGIPVSSVHAFEHSLKELNKTVEIHVYEGVGHAFANPSGERYAASETKDAWDKTLAFLHRTLKGEQ